MTAKSDVHVQASRTSVRRDIKLSRKFNLSLIDRAISHQSSLQFRSTSKSFLAHIRKVHGQAESCQPEAQWEIGVNYDSGGAFVQEPSVAFDWFMRSTAGGYIPALCSLAHLMRAGVQSANPARLALLLLRDGVGRRDPTAAFNLGMVFVEAKGDRRNLRLGLELMGRAATAGLAIAAAELADIYIDEKYIARNYPRAVKWLRCAALAQDGDSARRLAIMYERGEGVRRSSTSAFHWMRVAASAGDVDAFQDLFRYFDQGVGTKKNPRLARHWRRRFDRVCGKNRSC